MRIGVLTEHEINAWRIRHARGEVPGDTPYMIGELERHGHELVPLRPVRNPGGLLTKVEHRLGYPVLRGLDLRTARTCDVVIALLETQGWAYSRVRSMIPGLPPLITLECWLSDDVKNADSTARTTLVRRARRLGPIISLSRNQTEVLRRAGIPDRDLITAPFAIDAEFFMPGRDGEREAGLPGGHDVLFVGQDRGRDLDTFLTAMASIPHRSALLVTKRAVLGDRRLPANVQFHEPVDHRGYRELLRRAPVVVVPTHELTYPTGQSVALEAAATGAPVVVTGTAAMREYIGKEDAELVHVGDAADLADALDRVVGDPAHARRRAASFAEKVRRDYCAEKMWKPVLRRLDVLEARRARDT